MTQAIHQCIHDYKVRKSRRCSLGTLSQATGLYASTLLCTLCTNDCIGETGIILLVTDALKSNIMPYDAWHVVFISSITTIMQATQSFAHFDSGTCRMRNTALSTNPLTTSPYASGLRCLIFPICSRKTLESTSNSNSYEARSPVTTFVRSIE